MENLKCMRINDARVYTIALPPLPAPLAELDNADDFEAPNWDDDASVAEFYKANNNESATNRVCKLLKYTRMFDIFVF